MESMVAEFKIDWARAIEDAAIEYAEAYVELQCDADNDHQREHLKALKDLRETIKRGLEVAAAPQPAARGVPLATDPSDPADIIAGALSISRGHAIEMMREAVIAAQPAVGAFHDIEDTP